MNRNEINKPERQAPPKFAKWLLAQLVAEHWRQPVIGDFEEIFHEIAVSESRFGANCWYYWQILRSLPAFINSSIYWSFSMLKSYLSTAWRNLMRQKGNALVKIFGLSIALSFCLLTFLMMSTEFTFDEFHENAARIYRVDYVADFNGKTAIYADAPMPVGASLKETLPEVEYAARLIRERGICRYQDKVLNETVHFAGQDFLNMFSFQLWRQSGAPLKDRDHIILSEAYAKKYFGEANPLGKTLTIDFPQGS